MNLKTTLTALALCTGALSISPLSLAGTGSDTAAAMTNYYNDTRAYCQSTSAPAFMCSGVLLRATVPGPGYHSWNPSPNSVASGGVSFSYLRADATFSKLAFGHNNGFTLTPYNYAPNGTIEPEVLCAFPIDAATDRRTSQGCGDSNATTEVENYCQTLGVNNAELWRDAYFNANKNNSRQCGFDVHDTLNIRGAQAFYESIRAMPLIKAPPASTQNELRLAAWLQDAALPIQSFFYTADGLADAQADQADWFATNGTYVPIISIDLPINAATPTEFTYLEGDQVICESYIQSGSWVKRFDPGINREAWTLEVTPTQCGRRARDNQTNAAYAEMVQKFGNDAQWNEENGGGMRRQLVCHYVIARNKPTWNLEPFRPDVTHQQSIDARCNPTASSNASAYATLGLETASAMTTYYADTRQNCGAASSPAFMCSGIMLRGTDPSPTFHAWNPSDASKASGGVSFSYLRADTALYSLHPSYKNGFTFLPYNFAVAGMVEPEVLCSFPWNADTIYRLDKGCGDDVRTADAVEPSCQLWGWVTGELWLYYYNYYGGRLMCGFDVRDTLNVEAAKGFYESIRARQVSGITTINNELRLATWADNIPLQLPIQSFFYVTGGLAGAQADQQDWYNTTGKFMPIVEITLPSAANPTAKFVYNQTDQVVF